MELAQGCLVGRMEARGYPLRSDATLTTLTKVVVKAREIEGEILNDAQVRSSLARRLGMDVAGLVPTDRVVLLGARPDEVDLLRAGGRLVEAHAGSRVDQLRNGRAEQRRGQMIDVVDRSRRERR